MSLRSWGRAPRKATTCTPAEEAEHPFSAPSHVAVSALTGEVFVLDGESTVDVFKPVEVASVKSFEYVRQFVAPAGVNFKSLIGITVDGTEGDVYLASARGVFYEFTTAGAYLGRITATPSGALGTLRSVAVDAASHDVYVGEFPVRATRSVHVYGANLTVPSVVVASPTGLAATSVTLNGLVDPEGAGEASCRFEYGTSLSYGKEAPCTSPVANGNIEVPVQSGVIEALAPDTVYHYRLDATNVNGTNTGEDDEDLGEFLTPGPGIEEASASDVSATAVTLNASINPNGAPTSYYFQYSTANTASCPASCTSVPVPAGEIPAGTSEVEVPGEHVQSLSPGTVYHFRVVAASNGETFYSPDQTFTTQTAGSFTLADGRQWELVSPADKHGALILPINERGVMQAAANGDAMSYVADAPTETAPSGYAEGVQVFSTRGAGGWQSRDITLPHEAATRLSGGNGFEFRFFSEDLSQGIVQPFGALVPSISPEASEQTAMLSSDYLNANPNEPCQPTSMHCFRPLVTGKPGYANVPEPGTTFGEESECSGPEPELTLCGPHFLDATPDASHIVLSSTVGLDPQITGEGLYEWTAGTLAPVSLLPKGAGAALLPGLGAGGDKSPGARGAISEDGSRVFWSGNSGGKHLFVRDVPREETVQLDVPQGVKVLTAPNPEFQVASADGSTVFLTDTQHLTADSGGVGADLYQCEVTEEAMGVLKASLTDVAPGGDVRGQVLGISKDGSWVYFVANGVLAPGAVHGTCQGLTSTAGEECNLYVRHAGVTQLVAVLSGADKPDWDYGGEPDLADLTARVSPDGHWLSFMSSRELTGYDNRDVVSGQPDEEVFLYEAVTGRLTCASCNPTGARPVGEESEKLTSGNGGLVGGDRVWGGADWLAANVPGWTPFEVSVARYQSRYLSDSGRLFFNARDGLVPQAVNESWDVYEFEPVGVPVGEHACSAGSGSGSDVFRGARGFVVEGRVGEEGAGCVALMSSGESPQESAFLDASESGGDVFFLTTARLEPRLDYDSNIDVYDAHECTGVSPCSQPPAERSAVCETEASCKVSPSPQPPLFGAPASATFSGPGNAPPSSPPSKPVVRLLTRAQKLAAALRVCRRDHARSRRVSCERAARKRYGPRAKKSSDRGKPVGGKGGK